MGDVLSRFPTASHMFVLAPPVAAEAFDLMLHSPAMAELLTPKGASPAARWPGTGRSGRFPRTFVSPAGARATSR
ncbi:MAG: hypothetical protein ACT4QG_12715 [Sporichthyaceae bacterium]